MALQLEDRINNGIKNSANYRALTEKPYGISSGYKGIGQELLSYFKSFNVQKYKINAGNYKPSSDGYSKAEGHNTAEQPGYNAERKDLSNSQYNSDMKSYFSLGSFNNKLYRASPTTLEKKFEIPSRYFVFDNKDENKLKQYRELTPEYNFYLMYKLGSADKLTPGQRDQAFQLEAKLDQMNTGSQSKSFNYDQANQGGKSKDQLFLNESQIAPKRETSSEGYALLSQKYPQMYRLFMQEMRESNSAKPFEDITKTINLLLDEIRKKEEQNRPLEITSFPAGGFSLSSVDGLAKLAMSYAGKSSYSGSKSSGSSSSGSSSSVSSGSSGGSGGGK